MHENKVYVVYYGTYGHISDIEGIFDSMEQVRNFEKRFATNQPLHVLELPLNPPFTVNKEKIPYLIEFKNNDPEPLEISELCSIEDCSLAARNTVKKEYGKSAVYLFASDADEALRLARGKVDLEV